MISQESFNSGQVKVQLLLSQMERVIRGKRGFLENLTTAFLAGGHVLIEDLPGTGKTTAAKTFAALLKPESQTDIPLFRRIQFTPDLLPYDVTGVDVFDPESRLFQFRRGPVFSHILLADEINRATSKVQSALLEVMAENQVTIGNRTHRIEGPFFVMATQNPVEFEGTYPLSQAQQDRFLMSLSIGYPDSDWEEEIVMADPHNRILPELEPVISLAEARELQALVREVYCDPKLIRAAVMLARETRENGSVMLGVSPRGSLMLVQAARARAFLQNRDFVTDQDLVELAPLVLAHRIRMKDLQLQPESYIREAALGFCKKLA